MNSILNIGMWPKKTQNQKNPKTKKTPKPKKPQNQKNPKTKTPHTHTAKSFLCVLNGIAAH